MTATSHLNHLAFYLKEQARAAENEHSKALFEFNWPVVRASQARAYTLAYLAYCIERGLRSVEWFQVDASIVNVEDQRGKSGIIDDLVDVVLADLQRIQKDQVTA